MLAGVPLYKVWVVVSKRTATPLNATWAMTALAFFLGLPILFSPSTFLAMGSISFAGLYISCELPPSLRASCHMLACIVLDCCPSHPLCHGLHLLRRPVHQLQVAPLVAATLFQLLLFSHSWPWASSHLPACTSFDSHTPWCSFLCLQLVMSCTSLVSACPPARGHHAALLKYGPQGSLSLTHMCVVAICLERNTCGMTLHTSSGTQPQDSL
jgi:hypothetical protein